MNDVETTPYESCSLCGGHGLRHGASGYVEDCYECDGSGVVRARDVKGRFTRLEVTELFLRHGQVADAVFDAITPNRIDTTSVAAVIPFERNKT